MRYSSHLEDTLNLPKEKKGFLVDNTDNSWNNGQQRDPEDQFKKKKKKKNKTNKKNIPKKEIVNIQH